MALWGNKDSKSATGTVSIADTGVVTGSSTAFTTQAKIGNTIRVAGVDYEIVAISSNKGTSFGPLAYFAAPACASNQKQQGSSICCNSFFKPITLSLFIR